MSTGATTMALAGKMTRAGLAIALCLSATGLRAEPDPFDGFDRYVEKAMTQWQTPGLAIVVVHQGKDVYRRAFGVREAGKPAKVDLDTVFALSSNSKAFTAAAASIAVDEGKLHWDDPVSEHLDHFQLADPWVTRVATMRDLMSHRLAGDLGVGKLELWAFTALSRDDVLRRLRYLDIGPQRFRSAFDYSNPNISAVGQVVGAVAGTSWDEYIVSRLLKPLQMHSATIDIRDLWKEGDYAVCYMCDLDHTPGHEQAKVDNIAMPHIATEAGPKVIPWRTVDNIAPAGSISASVLDFAKFMRMHLDKGVFAGQRILSEAAIEEMHRPQMLERSIPYPGGAGFGENWAYGLGWHVGEYHGRKVVIHTGGITGWRSAIVMFPEERLGIAVVANQHSTHLHSSLAHVLGFVAFDRVLGMPRVDRSGDWLAAKKKRRASAQAAEQALLAQRDGAARPSAGAVDLTGTYQHPAFGEFVVDSASKRVKLAGVMQGRLEHWRDDLYRVTWIGPWPSSYFLSVDVVQSNAVGTLELHGFGAFSRVPAGNPEPKHKSKHK